MALIKALILGLIQGVTASLPISSSGHTELLAGALKTQPGPLLPFMTLLHLGTLIAVVLVFYRDIVRLGLAVAGIFRDLFFNIRVLFGGRKKRAEKQYRRLFSSAYRKFALLFAISIVPTFVIGRLLAGLAFRASGMLLAAAVGFFITALILFVSSYFPAGRKGPTRAGIPEALLVGAFQGISVFPGISRLGMVLSSANLCGFSRKFAIRYAYLMSIPSIIGALAVELPGSGAALRSVAGIGGCVLGVIAAALAALFMLRICVRLLKRRPDRVFALYCVVAGIATVVIYVVGRK